MSTHHAFRSLLSLSKIYRSTSVEYGMATKIYNFLIILCKISSHLFRAPRSKKVFFCWQIAKSTQKDFSLINIWYMCNKLIVAEHIELHTRAVSYCYWKFMKRLLSSKKRVLNMNIMKLHLALDVGKSVHKILQKFIIFWAVICMERIYLCWIGFLLKWFRSSLVISF